MIEGKRTADDESAFRTWYLAGVQAWNDADIALLSGPDGGGTNSPGVGCRFHAARLDAAPR